MIKIVRILFSIMILTLLSACVTQQYENDNDTPVIQNDSTTNEIAMTRISLGLGYLKMGNTTQAKLNLEKAKRFSPNLTQVYTAFAHYYDTVGEPELAIESYEKALSIDGKNADTLNNYGVFLCRQEEYQAAEKQILKAIAIPSYILVAQSYENLALCQLKAKKFTKSELYLNKAIQHSPTRAATLLQMVRLQYAKSNYKKAQLYLQRYEKSTRRFSPDALALAYKIHEKQANKRIAKNYAGMLIKLFPRSYEAKQYILNGLDHIEADELAKQYQLSLTEVDSIKPKKRVVVLSPKKVIVDKKAAIHNSKQNVKINNIEKSVNDITSSNIVNALTENNDINLDSNKGESLTDKSIQEKTPVLPVHIVAKGDSLFSISKKYNIHMINLERWSNVRRNGVLRIGDVIYLANPKKVTK